MSRATRPPRVRRRDVDGGKARRAHDDWLAVGCVLSLCLVTALAASAEPRLDLADVGWRRLVFRHEGMVADAELAVSVESLPAATARAALVAGEGALPAPAAGQVVVLDVEVEADVRVTPWNPQRGWGGRSWLMPGSGSALQRTRDKLTGDRNRRVYRYGEAGVVETRLEPADDGERALDPSTWSARKKPRALPYPPDRAGCGAILDPAAVLLLVSGTRLAPGDPPLVVCAFNKKHIHRVDITALASEATAVDYEREGGDGGSVVDSSPAVRLAIRSRPVVFGKLRPEPFELLGIEGDVEIWVEETSRLPLRIRGRAGEAGDVDFRLRKAALAHRPSAHVSPPLP